MKIVRRLIVSGIVLALVIASLGFYIRHRALQVPRWYRKLALDDEARQAAANSMDQKLIGTVSAAQSAHAAEVRARNHGATSPTTLESANPITISLTEDEINAFFITWDQRFHWKEKISSFAQDPVVVIEQNELILAATMKGWDSVISLHLLPRLENGKLHISLTEVTAGTLPLPMSAYSSYLNKLIEITDKHLPELREQAQISPRGWANGSAVAAAMSELLIRTMRDQPAEPVLFIPDKIGHDSRSLPVVVTGVTVADKALTLTLQPMDATQREALLQHIRGNEALASGK
jgi:hypothetical protein